MSTLRSGKICRPLTFRRLASMPGGTDADTFLMAIHFLARYPTDEEQSAIFKLCDRTIRDWKWFYAKKIQALKGQKVSTDASCCLKSIVSSNALHLSPRLFGPRTGTTVKTSTFQSSSSRSMGFIVVLGSQSIRLCQRTRSSIRTSSIKLALVTRLRFQSSTMLLCG